LTAVNCPAQTKLIHHSFTDPSEVKGDEETRLSTFRRVRDQIQEYLNGSFVEIIGKG